MKQYKATTYLLIIGLVLSMSLVNSAQAAGTRYFQLHTLDDMIAGELQQLGMDMNGILFPLAKAQMIAEFDVPLVFSILPINKNSILVGTNGSLFLIGSDSQVQTIFKKDGAVFTDLLISGKTIYVASGPDSSIYRFEVENQKIERWVKLPADYVWTLIEYKDDALIVGTGSEGQLWKVYKNGKYERIFDSTERHLLTMAQEDDGSLWIGGEGVGILYRMMIGQFTTILKAPQNEISAVRKWLDGSVLLINNGLTGEFKDLRRLIAKGEDPETESYLIQVWPDGASQTIWHEEEISLYSLFVAATGDFWAGTGHKGWLLHGHNDRLTYWGPLPELEVLVITESNEGLLLGTGNPGRIYLLKTDEQSIKDAAYISKELDSQAPSKWGAVRIESASNEVTYSTRSGNSPKAGDDWSSWSDDQKSGSMVLSPPARYLQCRIKWENIDTVRSILIAYGQANHPPVLSKLTITEPAIPSNTTSKNKEKNDDNQDKKSTDQQFEAYLDANRTIEVEWRASDPDSDLLEYRLEVELRLNHWVQLMDWSSDNEYKLNPAVLPEGLHRLRVVVRDLPSNPELAALNDTVYSSPIFIDNQAPEIKNFKIVKEGEQSYLDFIVEDQMRVIIIVQWAKADGEFQALLPIDGIFDQLHEEFRIPWNGSGVIIKALDQANNYRVASYWGM